MRYRRATLGIFAALLACAEAASLGACGSSGGATGGSGGEGPSSGTGASSTGTGAGGTDTGGTGGAGPMTDCDKLCGHITSIDCKAWTTCTADCAAKLAAPVDCGDEFDTLLACWVQNLPEFTCTMLQLLPPEACHDAETAFHECFAPDVSCICSAGVGNSGADKCARKTTCGSSEFATVCQAGSAGWNCSCYDHDTLLGTCTEDSSLPAHCDNDIGCCSAYFCAP